MRVPLPSLRRVLAVVAHPDDESFGLGGVIGALVDSGAQVDVLSLTAGEASTLQGGAEDLVAVRSAELHAAAAHLGVSSTTLLRHPDGSLSAHLPALVESVRSAVSTARPDALLVFGSGGGVTGHPDHEAATTAALTVARERGLLVLEWCLPIHVADTLRRETGGSFTGYATADLPLVLTVDRERQQRAIRAHASQAVPGSVLWRRLELLEDREHLRLTRPDLVPTPKEPA
jgi:N-acetylglucosamine malate deacetylase 2